MARVVDHYAQHLAPLYEWMVGDVAAALTRSAAELDAANVPNGINGTAVDLGAGIGLHALPLAQRGYAVIAIDSNQQLLTALQARAGSLSIATINADLLEFQNYLQRPAEIILCMGDTLTHLQSVAEVAALLAGVADSLTKDGVFVATFRDYVTALTAERRFVPVQSDAHRILTCFLEYAPDVVVVHDVLYQWQEGRWMQRVSSYSKLRLAPKWVAATLQRHGLATRTTVTQSGMVCVVARKD